MKTVTVSEEDIAVLCAVRLRCGGPERLALDRLVDAAEQAAPHGKPIPRYVSGQGEQVQQIAWQATPGNEILSGGDGALWMGISRGKSPLVMFPIGPAAGQRRAIAGVTMLVTFTDYPNSVQVERISDERPCLRCRLGTMAYDAAWRLWDCKGCQATFDAELQPYECFTCHVNLRKVGAHSRMKHARHRPGHDPEYDAVRTCGRPECKPRGPGFDAPALKLPEALPAVGDYVRWDAHDRSIWAEGELVYLGESSARIRIERKPDGWWYAAVASFTLQGGATLRKVPRPGECTAPRVIEEFSVSPAAHPPCAFCDAALTTFTAYEHGTFKVCETCYDGIGKAGAGVFRGMSTWQIETFYDASRDDSEGPLRNLLAADEAAQRERNPMARETFGEKQRKAVAAYRSAQLHERVAAGDAADKARAVSIVCDAWEDD